MLSFKSVSKSFGDIKALKNASFEVKKGEFIFITGPSGAGKTTVLKLILKEYLPDTGEIVFNGKNLSEVIAKKLPFLRQKIGVVFQDMKVLTERTVRENVEVGLAVLGVFEEEWNERVEQVLKLVGLDKRADQFPSQLSGGELQRVSLARALIVDPIMILADEPTGNLDWDTTEAIMKIFEKVNENGKTVIMATHNKMIIDSSSKRKIELKDGEIIKDNGLKVISKKAEEKESEKELEKETEKGTKENIDKEDDNKKEEKNEKEEGNKEEAEEVKKEAKSKKKMKVKVEEV
ncbi:MAG: cell division ATP-binding protein FtsE [Patescibacteria group bacterium]